MHALDRLIPTARLLERDSVELAASPDRVWEAARHANLAGSPIARALFSLRTLPTRLGGRGDAEPLALHIDDLRSTADHPGFQVLGEDPPREIAVGAIGKVWKLDIPFVHVEDAGAFARFVEPDYVKVAWALLVEPRGERGARLTVEVRVDATDDRAWRKFRRYFSVIGPGSRLIRRMALHAFARDLGTPEAAANERPMPGDTLLTDLAGQMTQGIEIGATPEAIWPWLVQMGCRRGGFYSYDVLDNGNARSAREIHPELQDLRVGDVLPATPRSADGFEVLEIDPGRALVLGGLFDPRAKRQLPFRAPRPESFWHVTWAFELERLDETSTRLHVRGRAAASTDQRARARLMPLVHAFMERAQLRHLKARAEGRLARDDLRDVLGGLAGAGSMLTSLFTPFLREERSHWGLDAATAARAYPGDDLVPLATWSWTHGVEIDAPAEEVWPWVAQIGGDRAGFYSHQWLENLVGCEIRNAETVHPDWAAREGDLLVLHPEGPALRVVKVEPGRALVGYGPVDDEMGPEGSPWLAASWLFTVEPLGPDRCRFISRFRARHAPELDRRFDPARLLAEPVGFVMDRQMLLGVKARAEGRRKEALARRPAAVLGAQP